MVPKNKNEIEIEIMHKQFVWMEYYDRMKFQKSETFLGEI